MKAVVRKIVLLAGVLGAGALFAYGTQHPDSWGMGHSAPGFHRPGVGMGGIRIDQLNRIRQQLQIRPEQEQTWSSFVARFDEHARTTHGMYESIYPSSDGRKAEERFHSPSEHWQQRDALRDAAQELMSVLDERQRTIAAGVLGQGIPAYQ